jgi:hypothetical protein
MAEGREAALRLPPPSHVRENATDGLDGMSEPFYSHSTLYDEGIAVGSADIKNDTVLYRFRDELFEFPTSKVYHLRFSGHGFNGYFYTAPVEELRKLKAEAADTA